jgi:hypothetical protein
VQYIGLIVVNTELAYVLQDLSADSEALLGALFLLLQSFLLGRNLAEDLGCVYIPMDDMMS